MNLLGWYKTSDESGGGSHQDVRELVVDGMKGGKPVYRDERPVQRYYRSDATTQGYLYKFKPQFHPKY